ncbi:hypothetical protein ECG_09657 [Echinococcus granulosus]|uniref:Protein tweety homolog n=1 Tax=Echinococcus granulosus TaxID=6210 RepID=A0A068WS61_ECHGR|nr:hypothetical protein ECG_09657 [Echinococcus granulosus]CDS20480.1 Sugar transporter [Echinococcus granulosus]
MATVAAVMEWVVRVENGGLLNALFVNSPTNSQDPQFTLAEGGGPNALDFLINMLRSEPLSLPILEAMPESHGGGVAGVNNANAHPNREPEILWITTGLLGTIVILIIVLQIINCCCCCCGRRNRHLNRVQMVAVDTDFEHKNLVCRIIYITLLVIALLFVTASVILLAIYSSSTGLIVSYLEAHPQTSTPNPTSLPDGLQATVKHLSIFIESGIKSGQKLTNKSLDSFVRQTNKNISLGLHGVISNLLDYLKASGVVEKGKSNLDAIKNCSANADSSSSMMKNFQTHITDVKNRVAKTKSMYQKEFDKIKLCDGTCEDLKKRVEQLQSPFDPEKLTDGVLDTLARELDTIHNDLAKQQEKLQTAINDTQGSADQIMASLEKELNLQQILSTVDELWPRAETQSQELVQNIRNAIEPITTQVSQGAELARITLYSIGGFFIFMVLIAILISVRLLYRGVRDRLYGDPDDVSVGSSLNGWDKLACGKCSACCCSVFFVPVLLIFGILVGALLFLLTTISGEGCIYLSRESAVNKTDFVMNSLVAEQWGSILGDTGGNGDSLLNASPPRNVLTALMKTCDYAEDQAIVGLLSAMKYENLVDVQKLVNSQKQASNESALESEVGSQYDRVVMELTSFMEKDGSELFAQLTQELLPCREAHEAYSAVTGATCGGVNLLLGFVYVLALNVLFLVFLYFALFNLAFFQGVLIDMSAEEEEEEEEEDSSSDDDDESEESDESTSSSSVSVSSESATSDEEDDSDEAVRT